MRNAFQSLLREASLRERLLLPVSFLQAFLERFGGLETVAPDPLVPLGNNALAFTSALWKAQQGQGC